MSLSVATRQAYSEIDTFIELLDEYNKNKIPQKLRLFFKKNKDINYIKEINPNRPIDEQNLKNETLALIAMLNLKYWCESEEEKERLKSIYEKNEIKYQEELREKYNPDNIFKNKEEKTESEEIPNTAIVEYKKDTIFEKIKRFLSNIFKIK